MPKSQKLSSCPGGGLGSDVEEGEQVSHRGWGLYINSTQWEYRSTGSILVCGKTGKFSFQDKPLMVYLTWFPNRNSGTFSEFPTQRNQMCLMCNDFSFTLDTHSITVDMCYFHTLKPI
jgi:hypothetical protein